MKSCPTCKGKGKVTLNVWSDDIQHWRWRLLHEGTFDQTAIDAWSQLYRVGGWRKSQAMEILHKLLKKDHGSSPPDNTSAFMSKSVSNAWKDAPPTWWSHAFDDNRSGDSRASDAASGSGDGGKGVPRAPAWGKTKGSK